MAKAKKVNVDKRVESWLSICPAAATAADSPGLGSQLQQLPVLLGCWNAMGCWDPIYVLCYSATAMIQCYSTTGTTINVF